VSGTESGRQLNVEVENNVKVTSLSTIHRLRCVSSSTGHIVWETIFTSKVNAVAANRSPYNLYFALAVGTLAYWFLHCAYPI